MCLLRGTVTCHLTPQSHPLHFAQTHTHTRTHNLEARQMLRSAQTRLINRGVAGCLAAATGSTSDMGLGTRARDLRELCAM